MKVSPNILSNISWKTLLFKKIQFSEDILNVVEPPFQDRQFSFDKELLRWTENQVDAWNYEDALRGTVIMGATGGGKSSGSSHKIREAFLLQKMGGVVFCVKKTEATDWLRACESANRMDDVCHIQVKGNLKYNFLNEEANFGSESIILNISKFFFEVVDLINTDKRAKGADPFWEHNVAKLFRNALVLNLAQDGEVTIRGVSKIINLASLCSSIIAHDQMQEFVPAHSNEAKFEEICKMALINQPTEETDDAVQYFKNEFIRSLPEDTRACVVAAFGGMSDSLLRYPLADLLCSETTIRPADAFNGKIIIIDVPVHVYGEVGRIINLIWKVSFQKTCNRVGGSQFPVFLWIDECQYLLGSQDTAFQTTARDSRCCTVALTQNIKNMYQEIGSKDTVEAILGSLHNKIYHQNGEDGTNEFASRSIGQILVEAENISISPDGSKTISYSSRWEDDVPKRIFTNLSGGGQRGKGKVEAIVHIPGTKFSSGKPWIKANFSQVRGK